MTMNVYNRATGWGAFATLVLLAGVLVLDIWLLDQVPILQSIFELDGYVFDTAGQIVRGPDALNSAPRGPSVEVMV